MSASKKCNGPCGLTKPASAFYSTSATRDGLRSQCKACIKAANSDYRRGRIKAREVVTSVERVITLGKGKTAASRYDTLLEALTCGRTTARAKHDYEQARLLAALYQTFDKLVEPYELYLWHPVEWRALSRALRPDGPQPPPGTKEARWYALYAYVLKHWRLV